MKFFSLFLLLLALPAGAQDLLIEGDGFQRPLYSPDGQYLAFTGSGYAGLWVQHTSTGDIRQLTDEPAAGFGFSWSPDSRTILTRVARFEEHRRMNAAKTFNVETGEAEQLTEYRTRMPVTPRWSAGKAEVEFERPPGLLDDETPLNLVTSPDGSKLAFEILGGHLFVMNADGTNRIDLGLGHRPQFSPEGTRIVYQRTEDDGHTFTASDLFVVSVDGGEPVQVTQTPEVLEMHPAWGPDGVAVVYDAEGSIYGVEVRR